MEKILIIEDSRVAIAQITDILAGKYEVVAADTGAAGLLAAKSVAPQAILLDVGLPDIDGYQVCRQLKSDPATVSIPVLFITAMDAPEQKVRGFESGAEDYLAKPFYPAELLARVKVHLDSRRAREQAAELERLNLFRQMAVALSHEINNPLTTIYGNLHLLGRELEKAEEARSSQLLKEVRLQLARIQSIVDKLAAASQAVTTSYHDGVAMIDFDRI